MNLFPSEEVARDSKTLLNLILVYQKKMMWFSLEQTVTYLEKEKNILQHFTKEFKVGLLDSLKIVVRNLNITCSSNIPCKLNASTSS